MNRSFLLSATAVCILALGNKGYGQRMPSSYSLQPALEALHRRDVIALNSPLRVPTQSQNDYNDEEVNEPNPSSRNAKIDRLIAAYLAKDYVEDEDSDDDRYYIPEEKKKSYFRERDEKVEPQLYPSPIMSVFRERDIPLYTQSELADEFLREIEEEREMEREEKYKDALRTLWEKYQDQENEIFSDPGEKRTQFMQKKRATPVLPWLPYTEKRKRFPVAKRSPKVDKESRDLEEIFGKPSEDKDKKKKRSTDVNQPGISSTTETMSVGEAHHNHSDHVHHNHTERKHHKRDDEDESSESEEHEHDEYEEDSEEEYDPYASSEDEDENRKKKRDTSKLKLCQGHLCMKSKGGAGKSRQKKSIDWSQYFGLNRKKKGTISFSMEEEFTPEKLEKMDRKLQLIENEVLADTIKYTGSNPHIQSTSDIRRIKGNVMSNLATAYSLEKMRQAINKLKQSIENENHLERNQIESFEEKTKRLSVKKEKVDFDKQTHDMNLESQKMKEHAPESNIVGGVEEAKDEEDENRKKMKKRTRYEKYPILPNDIESYPEELEALNYEPLNDAYLGNKNYYQNSVGECAIADNIDEKCKNIAVLSGAVNSELLNLCNVHQICHLCSTTQVGCDFEYISEADQLCGKNAHCLSSVRANMRMLRDTAGPQIGLKECMRIPCLNHLLKDINKR